MNAVMQQNSPEWLEWRKQGIGASDVPIILGVSPWKTPLQLWEEKTGRREPFAGNAATRRGHDLEPAARAAYEAATGNVMEPAERTHQKLHFMRASLDGITFDGSLILEVKCPGKEAHAKALGGEVPDYYLPQVQAQLFVSAAERAHYWSFDGEAGVLIEVLPDVAAQERIVKACQAFWKHVQDDTAPDSTARDERDDAEWRDAVDEWRCAQATAVSAAEHEKVARERLIALAPQGAKGCGVQVVKVERAGSIKYAEALKSMLPDVDLSPWRGKSTITYQVRESKA